jgi:hypothetical protein
MVEDAALRRAVDTAWSLYRAKHRDVDTFGEMGGARLRDRRSDRLRPSLLGQSPQRRMLRLIGKLVKQVVLNTARPE